MNWTNIYVEKEEHVYVIFLVLNLMKIALYTVTENGRQDVRFVVGFSSGAYGRKVIDLNPQKCDHYFGYGARLWKNPLFGNEWEEIRTRYCWTCYKGWQFINDEWVPAPDMFREYTGIYAARF